MFVMLSSALCEVLFTFYCLLQEQISHLEDVPKELLCLYSEGSPLNDELSVESLASASIDVTIPLLGGTCVEFCLIRLSLEPWCDDMF